MDISKTLSICVLAIILIGVKCDLPKKDRMKGALIGRIKSLQHDVAGVVYAVDEDTFYIENFHYDGRGPDAFFWVGNDTQPSPRGTIVPFPADTPNQKQKELPGFQGENLILHLPPGEKIVDLKWFSVWCRRFTVDFGHVLIPSDLDPPKKRQLPEFKRLAHGVRSGNVTILDAKTFYIPNLHYDGAGPDAFFWVGKGSQPNQAGQKIPNEMGTYEVLRGYEGEDIEIQLPDNLTMFDIDYLAIWCVQYRHNFGHVIIPPASDLWIPPALGQTRIKSHTDGKPIKEDDREVYASDKKPHTLVPSFSNCRQLSENLQVEWQARDNDVQIKLTGRIKPNQYMSFGLSSDQQSPQMLNSDIVVAYQDGRDGSFHAVDYTVTRRAQCDGTFGVCPDERNNGRNDASVIGGKRYNGITSVTYSRPYVTNDSLDIPIPKGSQPVLVIAAIGTLNNNNEANYHHDFVTKEKEIIDFNGVGENSCTLLLPEEVPVEYEPWPRQTIMDVYNLSAVIGPTGGDRGYKAITNTPSWGIAWWINDMLIPEIFVERGQTYYFVIEGGMDTENSAKFHPFYITDSKDGGFGQKTIAEQRREKIFAGVSYDDEGVPHPTALGRLCEWKHKGVDNWKESVTFKEYRDNLVKECEPGAAGSLVWTVMEDTPDLVYYQCYTHQNLGWKIHVNDPGFNLPQNGASGVVSCMWFAYFLVVLMTVR